MDFGETWRSSCVCHGPGKFSLQGENDVTVMKEFADKKEQGVGKVSAGIGQRSSFDTQRRNTSLY